VIFREIKIREPGCLGCRIERSDVSEASEAETRYPDNFREIKIRMSRMTRMPDADWKPGSRKRDISKKLRKSRFGSRMSRMWDQMRRKPKRKTSKNIGDPEAERKDLGEHFTFPFPFRSGGSETRDESQERLKHLGERKPEEAEGNMWIIRHHQ